MKKKTTKKKAVLKNDLKGIDVPFDLFTGLQLVTDELESRGFSYSHLVDEDATILVFKGDGRNVNINIESENLLIRQFLIDGDHRKLEVIYVVTPSERSFKLMIK
jgi:hypothetical protein